MRVSPNTTSWYLGATDEGWTLISSSGESADAMSRAIAADPHCVYIVRRVRGIRGRGIYDPAAVTRFDTIDAASAAGKVASAEQIRGILLFLRSVPDFEPFAESSAEFKPGSASIKNWTIRWPAIAHNTLAALVWLALPISLGWVPRMIRRGRAIRRQRAGLCPICAYDRRSTPAEAPCPECGQAPGASTTPA